MADRLHSEPLHFVHCSHSSSWAWITHLSSWVDPADGSCTMQVYFHWVVRDSQLAYFQDTLETIAQDDVRTRSRCFLLLPPSCLLSRTLAASMSVSRAGHVMPISASCRTWRWPSLEETKPLASQQQAA